MSKFFAREDGKASNGHHGVPLHATDGRRPPREAMQSLQQKKSAELWLLSDRLLLLRPDRGNALKPTHGLAYLKMKADLPFSTLRLSWEGPQSQRGGASPARATADSNGASCAESTASSVRTNDRQSDDAGVAGSTPPGIHERAAFWVHRSAGSKADRLLGAPELAYKVYTDSAYAASQLYRAIEQARTAHTESSQRRAAWRARVRATVAAQFLGAIRSPRADGMSGGAALTAQPAAAAAPQSTPRDRSGVDTSELHSDGTLRKRGQKDGKRGDRHGGGADGAQHDDGSLLARGRRRSVQLVTPMFSLFKDVQGGGRQHPPQQTPRQAPVHAPPRAAASGGGMVQASANPLDAAVPPLALSMVSTATTPAADADGGCQLLAGQHEPVAPTSEDSEGTAAGARGARSPGQLCRLSEEEMSRLWAIEEDTGQEGRDSITSAASLHPHYPVVGSGAHGGTPCGVELVAAVAVAAASQQQQQQQQQPQLPWGCGQAPRLSSGGGSTFYGLSPDSSMVDVLASAEAPRVSAVRAPSSGVDANDGNDDSQTDEASSHRVASDEASDPFSPLAGIPLVSKSMQRRLPPLPPATPEGSLRSLLSPRSASPQIAPGAEPAGTAGISAASVDKAGNGMAPAAASLATLRLPILSSLGAQRPGGRGSDASCYEPSLYLSESDASLPLSRTSLCSCSHEEDPSMPARAASGHSSSSFLWSTSDRGSVCAPELSLVSAESAEEVSVAMPSHPPAAAAAAEPTADGQCASAPQAARAVVRGPSLHHDDPRMALARRTSYEEVRSEDGFTIEEQTMRLGFIAAMRSIRSQADALAGDAADGDGGDEDDESVESDAEADRGDAEPVRVMLHEPGLQHERL